MGTSWRHAAALMASLVVGAVPSSFAGDLSDTMLQLAVRELKELPPRVNSKATICVGVGDGTLSEGRLASIRHAVPQLSLKPYTLDCLVPVTDYLVVRAMQPAPRDSVSVLAIWSRKSDEFSCLADGIRRRVYVVVRAKEGWRVSSVRDEKPNGETPMP